MRDYLVSLTLGVSALTAFSLPRLTFDELTSRPIPWSGDVVGGILRARQENKLVLVYFGADWDTAAKELEHRTFVDPEIRSIVRSDLVAVHVDTTDEDNLAVQGWQRQFKVVGDPTIVVLARGGHGEVLRFTSYVAPEVLAPELRAARDEPSARGHVFW